MMHWYCTKQMDLDWLPQRRWRKMSSQIAIMCILQPNPIPHLSATVFHGNLCYCRGFTGVWNLILHSYCKKTFCTSGSAYFNTFPMHRANTNCSSELLTAAKEKDDWKCSTRLYLDCFAAVCQYVSPQHHHNRILKKRLKLILIGCCFPTWIFCPSQPWLCFD